MELIFAGVEPEGEKDHEVDDGKKGHFAERGAQTPRSRIEVRIVQNDGRDLVGNVLDGISRHARGDERREF